MITAERADTAIPISMTLTTQNSLLPGATVVGAIYDPVQDEWLDNWSTGTWNAAKQTEPLVEGDSGRYLATANMSAADAGTSHFVVYYEVTAGGSGATEDILMLSNEVYDTAGAADQTLILADTDAIEQIVTPNLDVVLSTRATQSSVDDIDTDVGALPAYGDANWATAAGFAEPGDAMDLIANAVDAAALATDAVTEIRNAILADGTAFNGASIAQILADTDTAIPTLLTDIQGSGFASVDDSLEAIRARGDIAWLTGAGSSAAQTAAAVWDALAASYNDPDTMGEALNAAGGAFSPSQVADAVWTEAITDHLGAGQAAQYVSDILTDTAAIGPDVALILADTAVIEPAVTSNLDAPVSTRAVEGDSMVVSSIATDAVDAAALAADAVTEIVNAVSVDLDSHGAGSWATATGFAIAGDPMTLTAAQESDVVDAVWDEANSEHLQAGTTGESLDTAAQAGSAVNPEAIADAVWDEVQTGHTTAGTFGFYLDQAVSAAGDPAAVAAAVWDEAQSGYSTPGTFGYYLDGQVTDAGDPAAIADAVWDEVQSGHVTAGTFGLYLDSEVSTAGGGATPSQVADAVWDELASEHSTFGTFGSNCNVAVSTRAIAGDEMAITSASESAMADAAADAVWDEAASGHTTGGSFGLNLGTAVSTRAVAGDEMALTATAESDAVDAVWDEATAQHTDAGSFGLNLGAAVSSRAVAGDAMTLTTAADNSIADAVWDETASQHTDAGSFGLNMGTAVSTRAVAGDAMDLVAGAEDTVADAVWDEAYAAHTAVGSFGSRIDAAVSAAGDPAATADAVWDELQSEHTTAGTFGLNLDAPVSTAGDLAAIADAVWDEVQTGHLTADTFGLFLDSAVSAAGGGGLTQQGIVDGVWDEILPGNHDIADSASDIVQAALIGGVTPSVIAGAVWDALLSSHVVTDSMGQIMNAFKTGQLDTTTIIEAMNAGVAVVINSLSEAGQYTNPIPVILDTIYTGHKGDQLLTPVYRNGQLMSDVELDGSTQLAMEINNITTGDQYDIQAGVSVGPSGHIMYTTLVGDNIFEVAGKWAYQASGLDVNLAPFVSQRLTVRVYDDVA